MASLFCQVLRFSQELPEKEFSRRNSLSVSSKFSLHRNLVHFRSWLCNILFFLLQETVSANFDGRLRCTGTHTCSTTYFQPKMNVRGPSSWHHFLSKKCDRFRLHISSLFHASSMQRKVNPQARTVQGSRSGWQQAKPPRRNFNHRQARALE